MKKLFLMLSGMLLATSLFAQQHIIKGRVSVFKTMGLSNIQVESKKSGNTVTTDSLGFYELACGPKDVIFFRGETFYPKRVRIKPNDNEVNVDMKFRSDPENVDMAVGYGYISKANATTAYANLTRKDADFCSYNNIYDLISAKCAGVNVGPSGYTPGNEQNITIRGVNSINQSNPLYIVDGVRTSQIAGILPCDVKSISFLKDSEAAIYGASGGGGVILIETRTGDEH